MTAILPTNGLELDIDGLATEVLTYVTAALNTARALRTTVASCDATKLSGRVVHGECMYKLTP